MLSVPPWAFADIDALPEPKWPGQVGGRYFSREMLEEHYAPFRGSQFRQK